MSFFSKEEQNLTINIKLGKIVVRLFKAKIEQSVETRCSNIFNISRAEDIFEDLSFNTDSKFRGPNTPQNAKKTGSFFFFDDTERSLSGNWRNWQFDSFAGTFSRRSKAVELPLPSPPDAIKCPICLEKIPLKTAELPDCGHVYCFQCLKTWMEISNTCPVCKLEFTNFEVRHDGQLLRRGKTKPKKQVHEEIVTSEDRIIRNADDVCYACKEGSQENYLLICDGCLTKCCHTYCLKPAIDFVPQDEWFCDYCLRDTSFRSKYPTARLFAKPLREKSKTRFQLPKRHKSKRKKSRK